MEHHNRFGDVLKNPARLLGKSVIATPLGEEKIEHAQDPKAKDGIDRKLLVVDLIGEERVSNPQVFAERLYAEAQLYLVNPKTQKGWHKITKAYHNIQIESTILGGYYEHSWVEVTRSAHELRMRANDMFNFLTKGKGRELLKPFSSEEVRTINVMTYDKVRTASTQHFARKRRLPFPHVPRDFVVFTAVDPTRRIFVMKSVRHPEVGEGRGSCFAEDRSGQRSCAVKLAHALSLRVRGVWTLAIIVEPNGRSASVLNIMLFQDLSSKALGLGHSTAEMKELHNMINQCVFDEVLNHSAR